MDLRCIQKIKLTRLSVIIYIRYL